MSIMSYEISLIPLSKHFGHNACSFDDCWRGRKKMTSDLVSIVIYTASEVTQWPHRPNLTSEFNSVIFLISICYVLASNDETDWS